MPHLVECAPGATTITPSTTTTTEVPTTTSPSEEPTTTTEEPTTITEELTTTTEEPTTTDVPPTTTPAPGLLPNGCPADFSTHLLLPHEADCAKFYSCVNGNKVEMNCAPGTWFDFDLQVI